MPCWASLQVSLSFAIWFWGCWLKMHTELGWQIQMSSSSVWGIDRWGSDVALGGMDDLPQPLLSGHWRSCRVALCLCPSPVCASLPSGNTQTLMLLLLPNGSFPQEPAAFRAVVGIVWMREFLTCLGPLFCFSSVGPMVWKVGRGGLTQ